MMLRERSWLSKAEMYGALTQARLEQHVVTNCDTLHALGIEK